MAAMGVNWMIIDLPHSSLDAFLDSIRWVGEEVLPKVAGAGGKV
jgi:hypothetical protein